MLQEGTARTSRQIAAVAMLVAALVVLLAIAADPAGAAEPAGPEEGIRPLSPCVCVEAEQTGHWLAFDDDDNDNDGDD